jgi:hypothetical protein
MPKSKNALLFWKVNKMFSVRSSLDLNVTGDCKIDLSCLHCLSTLERGRVDSSRTIHDSLNKDPKSTQVHGVR